MPPAACARRQQKLPRSRDSLVQRELERVETGSGGEHVGGARSRGNECIGSRQSQRWPLVLTPPRGIKRDKKTDWILVESTDGTIAGALSKLNNAYMGHIASTEDTIISNCH
jgi:hypothetical protein